MLIHAFEAFVGNESPTPGCGRFGKTFCIALVLCVGAGLTGCATAPPTLTRDQFLAATTRVYKDKSPEQVIRAAETVLKLADADKFKFADTRTGFNATRQWMEYLVIAAVYGTDNWVFDTKVTSAGTEATVSVTTAQGSYSGFALPATVAPVQGSSLYDLFWARLDYLIGLRTDWMSCDEEDKRISGKVTSGGDEHLCDSLIMKDYKPTDAAAQKYMSVDAK